MSFILKKKQKRGEVQILNLDRPVSTNLVLRLNHIYLLNSGFLKIPSQLKDGVHTNL